MGKFAKGNKLAKGGPRPGSGRPTVDRKTEMDLVLAIKQGALGAKAEDGVPPLVRTAVETLEQAMNGRDEQGNVTAAGVAAAKLIFEARYGKAASTVDLTLKRTDYRAIEVRFVDSGRPFGAPSAS